MREGPFRRFWSRRPRRHVRRVATLEGKLPGQRPSGSAPNPQTPFVLAPRSRPDKRRGKTTFVVDLRREDLDRLRPEKDGADELADELVDERDG